MAEEFLNVALIRIPDHIPPEKRDRYLNRELAILAEGKSKYQYPPVVRWADPCFVKAGEREYEVWYKSNMRDTHADQMDFRVPQGAPKRVGRPPKSTETT